MSERSERIVTTASAASRIIEEPEATR